MSSSEPKTATLIVREKGSKDTGVVVHGAYVVSGNARSTPVRGTADLLQAYGASPVLQAVVRKIAMTMATIEWHAAVRGPDGKPIRVPNHIMSRMLNGGVPGLDGYQCKALEAMSKELAGEAFNLMERNQFGVPFKRWPIPSHWVKNTPSPMGGVFEVSNQQHGAPVAVRREDMFWLKDVDPYDPYRRGLGVARSLSDELNADEAAAKHMGSSLINRARPDIIISGSKDAPLGKEAAERLHQVWTQRFGGPENMGKPFVSSGPISVTQLTPSFRELQLTELRTFERDLLITVFGIPPEVMGVIENANRSTIETAEHLFMKHVITPRAEAMKAALNDQLCWQYDDRLCADYDALVQEDKEFRLRVMQTRADSFSDDEIRSLAAHDPLLNNKGNFPELEAGAERPGRDPSGLSMEASQVQVLQNILQGVSAGTISSASATTLISVAFPLIPDDKIRDMVQGAEGLELPESGGSPVQAPEPVEMRSMKTTKADEDMTLDFDAVVQSIDDSIITAVLSANSLAALAEFGEDTIEALEAGISFDLRAPRVEQFLTDVAGVRSNLINNTTRKTLRAALTEAVKQGEGTEAIVGRVREAVADAGRLRAEIIVRTEIVRASNFAAHEAHLQAGITEKEWLSTMDSRIRDSHAAMDGQRKPITEPFVSGDGFKAMYPGDFGVASEDINCRCVVIPVDSAGDSEEKRKGAYLKVESKRQRLEQSFRAELEAAFRLQAEKVIQRVRGV